MSTCDCSKYNDLVKAFVKVNNELNCYKKREEIEKIKSKIQTAHTKRERDSLIKQFECLLNEYSMSKKILERM